MRTEYIEQVVNEILTNMSNREIEASTHTDISFVPKFEDAFGRLLQEDDETSRDVMRRIWEKLQDTHRQACKG